MKQRLVAAVVLAALSVSQPHSTEAASHQGPNRLSGGRPKLEASAENPERTLGTIGTTGLTLAQGINCRVVEALGTSLRPQILAEINRQVSGTSYRINRRKTLRINRVEDIGFSGCRLTARTNVTLKRRIRRDAHGTVTLQADIPSFSLPARQVCYANARVTDVNLSRTLRIGEGVYKWVANKVLPSGGCLP